MTCRYSYSFVCIPRNYVYHRNFYGGVGFVLDGPSNSLSALFASAILHTNRRIHPSISTTCHANSIPNLQEVSRRNSCTNRGRGWEGEHFTYPVNNAFTYLLLFFFLTEVEGIIDISWPRIDGETISDEGRETVLYILICKNLRVFRDNFKFLRNGHDIMFSSPINTNRKWVYPSW